jgi:hypothetical protein
MDIPEYFRWPLTQNLAYRIVEALVPFPKICEDKTHNRIEIMGRLGLKSEDFDTAKTANCIFQINYDWLYKIPVVACTESWLTRKPPDWHVSKDGQLCFEFNMRWEGKLSAMEAEYTSGLTAEYAAKWLLNSTRSLLQRHLFAFRNGITIWPKVWNYWAHGQGEAEQEYCSLVQLARV